MPIRGACLEVFFFAVVVTFETIPATTVQTCEHSPRSPYSGLWRLTNLTSTVFPQGHCSKRREHYDDANGVELWLRPQSTGAGGREGRKSECLCLFSALHHSGAWELQQLGRALRNILSCNVNMSELWSSVALPSQFSPSVLCKRVLPVT